MKPFLMLFAALCLTAATPALAQDATQALEAAKADAASAVGKDLLISNAYALATTEGQTVGAVFMEIVNKGRQEDLLVSASSPMAEKVEIHTNMEDENGVMQMRPLENIVLRGGEQTVLKPMGMHLMLMGLKQPLMEGMSVPVTVNFRKGGSATLQAVVHNPGYTPPQSMTVKPKSK